MQNKCKMLTISNAQKFILVYHEALLSKKCSVIPSVTGVMNYVIKSPKIITAINVITAK